MYNNVCQIWDRQMQNFKIVYQKITQGYFKSGHIINKMMPCFSIYVHTCSIITMFRCTYIFYNISFQDVIIGFVVGLAVPGWIVTGSIVYDYVPPVLPVSTRNCFNTSLSTYNGNHTLHVSPAVTQSISVTIPQDQDR